MGVVETVLLILTLVIAAMLLIVVEICTPTFGVLGILAIVSMGWAVYLCYTLSTVAGMVATVAAIILMPAYTVVAVKILPKTAIGRIIGLHRKPVAAGEGTPEAEPDAEPPKEQGKKSE